MGNTSQALLDRLGFRLMPKLGVLVRSIKGQLFIVFAATFLSVFTLTLLNFLSLSTVKARLLLGESYNDLLNDILKVRRFEKNFLFYDDAQSLQEGIEYLQRIDTLVSELSGDIIRVTDRNTFDSFLRTLKDYGDTMKAYSVGSGADSTNREEIRQKGKALVDFAEQLVKTKRERIHRAILQTSILPVAFLFLLLLLIILVIKLVSAGLLRPLSVLQSTIQRVAKGDYSPTPYEGLHTDEISGLIGAFNRMAVELETNQEHLLQARKIAALGTFTAGIAHELNNPINNISLTAETYLEEYSEQMDPEGKELIRDILSQTARAGEIVKNLLDFSRTERPALTNLDAAEIVNSTVALVKNQIMISGITLEIKIAPDLPPVRGNIRNLQQVFMNLFLNAIQAMPPGGAITVNVARDSAHTVRFDVRDTGTGIDGNALQHIFEPFFTTKEVGRGTGLGLAVAYAIVKRHGGKIAVWSELGKGSIFSVFLPVFGAERRENYLDTESWDHAGTHSGN